MAAQRLERGEKFLKKLSRRKLKFIFTMDEMLISTDDINGQTDFYYKQQGVVVPESWRKLPKKNWPKQIMVPMGICWHGKSRIYIVPSDVKVNADAFIKFILKPMIEKDIPALYKEDAKKSCFIWIPHLLTLRLKSHSG